MKDNTNRFGFNGISGSFFCPACGSKFSGGELDSVVERESGFVVSVKCSSCQLIVSMNVISLDKDELARTALFREDSSISTDDVIEFSRSLRSFNGNFRKAFMKIDRRS